LPAGDYIIVREATGGEDYDNYSAFEDHPFDTEVHIDSATFSNSTGQITVLETGHYLAMYNLGFDREVANYYINFESRLLVEGSPSNYCKSGDFCNSSSGYDDAGPRFTGCGILSLTANDTLIVQTRRDDDDYATVDAFRMANFCGFQMLRLDDSWAYYRGRETSARTPSTTSGTFTSVEFDTDDEKDSGFTHSTTVNPDQITLDAAGHYLVIYTGLYSNTSGTSRKRTSMEARLTLDGTEINATRTHKYTRGYHTGYAHLNALVIATIIQTTSTNQVLRAQICHKNNTSNPYCQIDDSAISIVKLPDSGVDFLRIEHNANQDGNSSRDLSFNVNNEVDTGTFVHSTVSSNERVTLQQDAFCLFMGMSYAEGSLSYTASNRLGLQWNIGDVIQQVGGGSIQVRNTYTETEESYQGGGVIMSLLDLSQTNYVEIQNDVWGTSQTCPHQANRTGMQAVNLDQLFGGAPPPERRIFAIT